MMAGNREIDRGLSADSSVTPGPGGRPTRYEPERRNWGLPWWSSGEDSMLSRQEIQVPSLVRKLDPMYCHEEFASHN